MYNSALVLYSLVIEMGKGAKWLESLDLEDRQELLKLLDDGKGDAAIDKLLKLAEYTGEETE